MRIKIEDTWVRNKKARPFIELMSTFHSLTYQPNTNEVTSRYIKSGERKPS